ncbi:Protein of unknown function [Gryllus bimaculatus]|nr:Protein of unknown function [Gryllus bimaculatus]
MKIFTPGRVKDKETVGFVIAVKSSTALLAGAAAQGAAGAADPTAAAAAAASSALSLAGSLPSDEDDDDEDESDESEDDDEDEEEDERDSSTDIDARGAGGVCGTGGCCGRGARGGGGGGGGGGRRERIRLHAPPRHSTRCTLVPSHQRLPDERARRLTQVDTILISSSLRTSAVPASKVQALAALRCNGEAWSRYSLLASKSCALSRAFEATRVAPDSPGRR